MRVVCNETRMSWEGYEERRCENGHLCARDVHGDEGFEPECPVCGGMWKEWRQVDQTNEEEVFGPWIVVS